MFAMLRDHLATIQALKVPLVAGSLCFLGACAAPPNEMADQPMYGGMNRQAVSIYRSADERLITGSIEAFGGLEKASAVSVEHGFKFVAQKEYSMAMKRFNQAWTLNPDNPRVYWGFGSVLLLRGKPCEAIPHFERVFGGQADIEGLADKLAQAYLNCADTNPALSPAEKAAYRERTRTIVK
ncbi:MAG: hypothetical protein U0412_03930 [Nitrospira sp.]